MYINIIHVPREYFLNNYDYKYICRFDNRYPNNKECYCPNGNYCFYCDNDEKQKCIGYTYIICPKCNNRTTYGTQISADNEFISYYCNTCDGYYGVCIECYDGDNSSLLQLLKHHNYYNIEATENDYFDIIEDDEYDGGETYIKYTTPTYFFSEAKFDRITGPDGGFISTWYCNQCDKQFNLSDK